MRYFNSLNAGIGIPQSAEFTTGCYVAISPMRTAPTVSNIAYSSGGPIGTTGTFVVTNTFVGFFNPSNNWQTSSFTYQVTALLSAEL